MKLPKQKVFNLPIWLILTVVIFLLVGGGYFYFRQQSPIKTLDQFPIMLINKGQTAVYQEVRVSADKIEKEIVVSNISSDSKNTRIYEVIPKEIAQKASELEFSVKPTIVEDDPIILWDLPSMHEQTPSRFTYKAPTTLGISKSSSSKTKPYCTQKPEIAQAMKKLKYDPEDWDDCDFYVSALYKAAVEKNKQLREEREKDQVQLIQPEEAKYTEIQQKAKAVINPPKPTSAPILPGRLNAKISSEEAVSIIKKNFGVAKDKECEAVFNNGDNGWRIVCNKQNYWVGSPGKYGTFYDFNYNFFFVSSNGKTWTSKGDYSRWQRDEGRDVRTFGKPMWGVQ